ncbi:hypothetical protein FRZ06_09070 [Anoxybacterium hadale]|uniref:Uncharacterized protein n=1 Tax=Anoxybacterium hadale TaxID=3408580 RepID=A0ACD1AAP1_9FIRM|nr:hypothetical protein FRZ06_09070 [Clostridiales bacterium]
MNNTGGMDKNKAIRIDELLEDIHEMETTNLSDGSELLQDQLSEEERERILSKIQTRMKAEAVNGRPSNYEKVRFPGRRKRILLASLAALCVFASTAFAAELFQWDSRISNYFEISDENQGDLSGAGMNVGVKDENGGVTIEAVQTIGDASNMYILLDVTVPEGQVLHPQTGFDMIYLKVEGATGMGYSCDLLPDDDPSDNKGTLLLSMEANSNINDKEIELKFVNLRYYDMESGEMIPDHEGEWILSWKLNYHDVSKNFKVGKDIVVNGETVRVDSVSISPIALNVKISGDYIKKYDSVPPNPSDGDLIEISSVNLKDGTVLTKDDSLGWGTSIDGKAYVINMKMRELLDPEGIDSIVLNDTVFKL